MRVSSLLLWPTAIGLAVGTTIPDKGNKGGKKVDVNIDDDGHRTDPRGIHKWNDFSVPVDEDEACVIFSTLEWLALSLIEPVQDITSEAGASVYVPSRYQGGPLVLVLRSVNIWRTILDDIFPKLAATNVWSTKTQLVVGKCYLSYAKRAGEFLESLLLQARDFDSTNPSRCLTYDAIEALYISYENVARVLYGGSGSSNKVNELLSENFPKDLRKCDYPFTNVQAGKPIREYIAKNDPALIKGGNLFAKNQAAWACSDFNDGDDNYLKKLDDGKDAARREPDSSASEKFSNSTASISSNSSATRKPLVVRRSVPTGVATSGVPSDNGTTTATSTIILSEAVASIFGVLTAEKQSYDHTHVVVPTQPAIQTTTVDQEAVTTTSVSSTELSPVEESQSTPVSTEAVSDTSAPQDTPSSDTSAQRVHVVTEIVTVDPPTTTGKIYE